MNTSLLCRVLGLILLSTSGCRERHTPPPGAMMAGASRAVIRAQLTSLHATILSETPEMIRAEYQAPGRDQRIRIELGFTNETLSRISALPRGL